VDRNLYPAPCNQAFLQRTGAPLVIAALSRFNIELNGLPQALQGKGLSQLEPALAAPLDGRDVSSDFFEVTDGQLRLRRTAMPAMLTLDAHVVRQDCLCYLMERVPFELVSAANKL
jgi:hypothetical protein